MEYILGGTAAATAGAICNPLEVVKIRMQLQGELLSRGKYAVHYRNAFHAAYTIASKEGIFALQKGLIPFTFYQITYNGIRLGIYQICTEKGWNRDRNGKVHKGKTVALASTCGALGGFMCSPFYLIKTHQQSKANVISIAVGHQHANAASLFQALSNVYRTHGALGLWRGATGNVTRLTVASAFQILSFEVSLEYMKSKFPGSTWTPLILASFTAGLVSFNVAPFDLVATRFFNQGTNAAGKGLMYRSIIDCTVKVYQKEGIRAFFKGWTACYFRLAPYTIIQLSLWDRLKFHYHLPPPLKIEKIQKKLLTH